MIFSLNSSTNCLDDLWDDVECQNSARESLLHLFSLVSMTKDCVIVYDVVVLFNNSPIYINY